MHVDLGSQVSVYLAHKKHIEYWTLCSLNTINIVAFLLLFSFRTIVNIWFKKVKSTMADLEYNTFSVWGLGNHYLIFVLDNRESSCYPRIFD